MHAIHTHPANTTLNRVTYYENDHLGNLRVAFTPVVDCQNPSGTWPDPLLNHPNSSFTLEHVVDYFPYGKILRQYVNSGGPERYLSTQHERDQETGLDYRGARYYDSDVARFLSTDPLAHKFPGWSPYNFVLGNPIRLVDPDGRAPECGCPTPPCGEVINRLEAVYNAITDPIAQARDNALNTIGSGLSAVGNWLNGLSGDGGVTLTSRKRDIPTNNADRKGNADRELNVDYLLDYTGATRYGPERFSPTLPERGAQTFTEGYNKLWEAGNIVKDNLTKENDSINITYFKDTIETSSDGRSWDGSVMKRDTKGVPADTAGGMYKGNPKTRIAK